MVLSCSLISSKKAFVLRHLLILSKNIARFPLSVVSPSRIFSPFLSFSLFSDETSTPSVLSTIVFTGCPAVTACSVSLSISAVLASARESFNVETKKFIKTIVMLKRSETAKRCPKIGMPSASSFMGRAFTLPRVISSWKAKARQKLAYLPMDGPKTKIPVCRKARNMIDKTIQNEGRSCIQILRALENNRV